MIVATQVQIHFLTLVQVHVPARILHTCLSRAAAWAAATLSCRSTTTELLITISLFHKRLTEPRVVFG